MTDYRVTYAQLSYERGERTSPDARRYWLEEHLSCEPGQQWSGAVDVGRARYIKDNFASRDEARAWCLGSLEGESPREEVREWVL